MTAEVLTVIEHEPLPVLDTRKYGQKALTQHYASALSKLEKKLSFKAWVWGNSEIKFQHYCGVVSLGSLAIEILPKIYGSETNIKSSRYALLYMLSRARQIKLHSTGMASVDLQRYSLLDIFILHFCDQLRGLLMQGMIQTYVERNENLRVLRGRLRIEQQLKHNLVHRERLYCQFDEFSEDNVHNQVLKYVLKILLKSAKANHVRFRVNELLMHFGAISDAVVDVPMLDTLSFDRSTTRYEPIFNQCRWFLKGIYPDVISGKESCISLLFDMNQLFEAFVCYELQNAAWSKGFRTRRQGPPKTFAWRQDIDKEVFVMKPDLSFLNKINRPVALADAKWKRLDESERALGISQADMYQMASYALRYGVERVMLAYPSQQKLTMPVQLILKGSGTKLLILPFDVTAKTNAHLEKFLDGISAC